MQDFDKKVQISEDATILGLLTPLQIGLTSGR